MLGVELAEKLKALSSLRLEGGGQALLGQVPASLHSSDKLGRAAACSLPRLVHICCPVDKLPGRQ